MRIHLISLLVSVTLAEMMFAMGLRLSFSKLMESLKDHPGFLFRVFVANYIVVPVITVLIIQVFHVNALIATGLMILGVTPAAPYGPPFTLIAKGNFALSTALMVILAASSAILAPLLLHFLLPFIISGDQTLVIDPVKLTGTLFVIQLLPMCMGLAIGEWRPVLSSKLSHGFNFLSKILNFMMISAIGYLQFRVLMNMELRELMMMVILVISGILAGWLLGWPGKENRATLSITTGMRNMSLSMGIAATAFPGSPVITTVLVYSFIAGSGLLIYAYTLRLFNQSDR